jgi:DNA-binding MarR family transcriptional regulator
LSQSEQLDHVGLALWVASRTWQERFIVLMKARGFSWFGEARADLLAFIDREGTAQTQIVRRARLSRQAVQQLLDELEHAGIVARARNPADARSKLVIFTAQGLDVLCEANAAKLQIEAEYRQKLGDEDMKAMLSALARLAG